MTSQLEPATPEAMLRLARRLLRSAVDRGEGDGPLCLEGIYYCGALLRRVETGELDAVRTADEACRVARFLIGTMSREARS
ncbi:hypothetical protein MKK55_18660 [Methylobacterium sp. J-059]|uniref:hypothetical protein n=1 Tax=Methylobacterium sp. J-059 TaxID=2836643 RepID=UPI001FB8DF28|nr:hypothetical protein [Methylobacterium sp. J-059]MCJ2040953.1 hypothetical protein [Methylobacterium sp. J-059]